MLPVIISVLGIIIFNTFNFLLQSMVDLAEKFYSTGYTVGEFLDRIF